MSTQSKAEQAVACFQSGFNCGQSVLAVFCEKYGLSRELALKLACGLGSGFRSGEFCGAISGGVLVVGLKYGQYKDGDKDAKARCAEKTVQFIEQFKKINNACVCRELLGCDPSTPEGRVQATPLFATVCVRLIADSVTLLEELGY